MMTTTLSPLYIMQEVFFTKEEEAEDKTCQIFPLCEEYSGKIISYI